MDRPRCIGTSSHGCGRLLSNDQAIVETVGMPGQCDRCFAEVVDAFASEDLTIPERT